MEYLISLLLVVLSAAFSGLTLGLMSLDAHELRRKVELKDKLAKRVYPIRAQGNYLLTVLLLGNVAVNTALSIFLGSIAPGIVAGVIATALIFLFGEIIPQAVISRNAVWFGAHMAWLVRIFMIIFAPVAWPIAKMLDYFLGEELPSVYSRHELMKVIEEHEDSPESDIDEDEERIIRGALSFSHKIVRDVMTPITVAVMIEKDDVLNRQVLASLRESGYSRFPVYEGDVNGVTGLLFLRTLVGRDLEGKVAGDFMRDEVQFVQSSTKLDDAFHKFLKTRQHLFVVRNEFGVVQGIVTIEDVLEEIVGSEILDEFDQHADLRAVAKENLE